MRKRQARERGAVRIVASFALITALACTAPAWDPDVLAARHPELGEAGARRLREITPYLLPSQASLILFLCRWTTEAPIPVALPPDADEAERQALETALRAWENAGLGVRFLSVARDEASLVIQLAPDPVATESGRGVGNTIANCRLGEPEASRPDLLPAELTFASVRLARTTPLLGEAGTRPVTPAELTGAALHELGHALGFQGHTWGGESAVARSPDAARRLGARVLAGEPFADAGLAALYAVPSGTVLSRVPVDAWRTEHADRLQGLARANAFEGPFARVGDRTARVFWRDRRGSEYGLSIPEVKRVLGRPERLLLIAEPRARNALSR